MLEYLEAQWALWLDSIASTLKLLTTESDYKGDYKDYLKPQFQIFLERMRNKMYSAQCDLTFFPTDYVRLFRILIYKYCHEKFKAGFEARAPLDTLTINEPSFAWAAEYYLGYYELHMLYKNGEWEKSKRHDAIYHLKRSQELITADMQR
jgi:hypothetical protein